MKIADLRAGQNKVEVKAKVTDVGETRQFERFGRTIRVATATIKDNSGSIALSLWNEDVDRIKKGNKIKISNGFIKEFQGEPQLTAGKFGKIEVLGAEEGEEKEEVEEPEEEAAEEEVPAEEKEKKIEEEEVGETEE